MTAPSSHTVREDFQLEDIVARIAAVQLIQADQVRPHLFQESDDPIRTVSAVAEGSDIVRDERQFHGFGRLAAMRLCIRIGRRIIQQRDSI